MPRAKKKTASQKKKAKPQRDNADDSDDNQSMQPPHLSPDVHSTAPHTPLPSASPLPPPLTHILPYPCPVSCSAVVGGRTAREGGRPSCLGLPARGPPLLSLHSVRHSHLRLRLGRHQATWLRRLEVARGRGGQRLRGRAVQRGPPALPLTGEGIERRRGGRRGSDQRRRRGGRSGGGGLHFDGKTC